MNILLINGASNFSSSKGELNRSLHALASDLLAEQHASLATSPTNKSTRSASSMLSRLSTSPCLMLTKPPGVELVKWLKIGRTNNAAPVGPRPTKLSRALLFLS